MLNKKKSIYTLISLCRTNIHVGIMIQMYRVYKIDIIILYWNNIVFYSRKSISFYKEYIWMEHGDGFILLHHCRRHYFSWYFKYIHVQVRNNQVYAPIYSRLSPMGSGIIKSYIRNENAEIHPITIIVPWHVLCPLIHPITIIVPWHVLCPLIRRLSCQEDLSGLALPSVSSLP